jgi:DNA recombination protein RmuC
MSLALMLGSGLILGAAVTWFLCSLRSKALISAAEVGAVGKVREAEGIALELRARISELRQNLADSTRDLSLARDHLMLEREQKAASQTELSQLRITLEDVSALRERLRCEGELRVAAETKLDEAQGSLQQQRESFSDAKRQLTETFASLASESLRNNAQEFLHLANSSFETIRAHAAGDLEARKVAIQALVAPLGEALSKYEEELSRVEGERQLAYGGLHEQLTNLTAVSQGLQKETGNLVNALRSPQARGRWGEMTLRRVAELAGMSEHCDFTEQETLENEAGRQRPDMIVNLPGNRRIVVDAKVPLQAFLDAWSAATDEESNAQILRHSVIVRAHMNALAARAYWEQFDQAPEIVVLFLPGESFLSPALKQDPTLLEDGASRRVLLATPTTLIALLRSIAHGWRQDQIARNAQMISDLGKQVYDRIKSFVGHLDSVGSGLQKAIDSYNNAVGSLENRVLPSARRFKNLGATVGEDILVLQPIDEAARSLVAPEVSGSGEPEPVV